MNKRKVVIIAIFIISIIAIVLLSIISLENFKRDNNDVNDNDREKISLETEKKEDMSLDEVKNPHMYFTVEACINKYLEYIANNNKEAIYKVLDSNYIQIFNITQENILEYVEKVDNDFNVLITEMYVEEVDNDNQVYYAKGIIKNKLLEKNTELCLTININNDNQIFSVVPYGYGGILYEQD